MFTINPAPTFGGTVQLGNPAAPLSLLFKHMTRREFRAWQARARDVALLPDDAARDLAEATWLAECLAGWGAPHHPVDAGGTAVPCSTATLQQLLDTYPGAGAAIFQQYERSLFEARAGN